MNVVAPARRYKEVTVFYTVRITIPRIKDNGLQREVIDTWAKFSVRADQKLDLDKARAILEERYINKLGATHFKWFKFKVQ